MPRQLTPAAETVGPTLPTQSPGEILDDAAKLESQRNALAELDQRYGLTGPYDRDALIRSAQTLIVESGMRILMLGRVFLLLKAHEADGGWLGALDQLGVSPRFAQRCMQTARKLEGSESRKLLAAQLSSSKVMELTVLDDDELDAVAAGNVEGMQMDDIDRMSIRELRAKVRDMRRDAEAADDLLKAKNEKLDQLDRQLRTWKRSPVAERAHQILQDAAAAERKVRAACREVEKSVRAAVHEFGLAAEEMDEETRTSINALLQSVKSCATDLELLQQR